MPRNLTYTFYAVILVSVSSMSYSTPANDTNKPTGNDQWIVDDGSNTLSSDLKFTGASTHKVKNKAKPIQSQPIDYAKKLDELNKQLQLLSAQNAISSQQLKAAEIKKDINKASGSYSRNANVVVQSNVAQTQNEQSNQNKPTNTVITPQVTDSSITYFSLQKISGSLNNPTAFIAFNGSVAQVKKGDALANGWQVQKILPNTVMLENKGSGKVAKTMQLYLAQAKDYSASSRHQNQNNQWGA